MNLDIGYKTDVGRRRDHNEDCGAVRVPPSTDEIDVKGVLLVVADGLGGHSGGEIASSAAVDQVTSSYYEDGSDDRREALASAIKRANQTVLEEAALDPDREGMGTTMAIAVVRNGELIFTNVGDCRVYIVRSGRATQVTRDHSFVAQLREAGDISTMEAEHHPMRNIVTRSIGGGPEVEVDEYPRAPLAAGDAVILCTDGLWGMVNRAEIERLIASLPAQAAAEALVDAANEAGGADNITAIVCRVLQDQDGANDATQLIQRD